MPASEYQRGYHAAYQEFFDVLDTSDRPHGCGGTCNACMVIRRFIKHGLERMTMLMNDKDFNAFLDILQRTQMANPDSPIFDLEDSFGGIYP